MPNAGLLYNENLSNAGGGGMDWSWIGTAISGIAQAGFGYGASKETNKAQTEQARLAGIAAQIQAGYGALGQDTSAEMLAMALANNANRPMPTPAKVEDNSKYIWLAIIAAVAVVAVVLINKKAQ